MMESFLVCVEPPVEYLRALAPPQSDRFHQVNSAAQELRLWMENNARKSVLGQTGKTGRSTDHLKSKLSFDDVDHRIWCVFGNKLNFGLLSYKKYILSSKNYLAVLVSTQLTYEGPPAHSLC